MMEFADNLLAGVLAMAVLGCVAAAMLLKKRIFKKARAKVVLNPQDPADTQGPEDDAQSGAATYVAKQSLMTNLERAAFKELYRMLGKKAYICPMVRIADLIEVEASEDRSAWRSAFNKISAKHVDFAVIKLNGDILFAVEVDDSTHKQDKRRKRDTLVNQVFQDAGIPLVRVEPGNVTNSEPLIKTIDAFFPAPVPEQKAA